MINICVIIPVYNHPLKIDGIIRSLTDLNYHCIVLDDGSDDTCQRILESLEKNSKVSLYRWNENRGKGAVVCDGLKIAHEKGFSHALQIDADGQHHLSDVEHLVNAANNFPKTVISALRPYAEMPKSRRTGRRITDTWVRIHTLSNTIQDSMCGFRIYPLNSTMDLLDKTTVGRRMDFDTEIIVKLYWDGADVKHVPIRIRYDDDMPSHFKLISDNWRISLMHTKLFLCMLPKIPKLLKRHIRS